MHEENSISASYKNYVRFLQNRITQLRTNKGISERKMSIALDKNDNYIRQITSGQIVPALNSIVDICNYFNLTISEFFDVENNDPETIKVIAKQLKRYSSEDLKRFSKLLNNIDPEMLKAILDIIYDTNNE